MGFLEVAPACQVSKTEWSCKEINVPNGHWIMKEPRICPRVGWH